MTPIPILLYHSVDDRCSADYRRWCIPVSLFDEHLSVVSDLGFTCFTVSDLMDRIDTGTLPERPLVVTFDDGRADFSQHAVPLLERHQIAATMYVVTSYIGRTSSWLPIEAEQNEPMMGWDDLRSLHRSNVECGAHSVSHPELDITSRDRARAEIENSRDALSTGIGRAVRSFAYPHGYYSTSVAHAAAAAGYDSACAVKNRWSHAAENRYTLSRLIIDGTLPAVELQRVLSRPPSWPERERTVLRLGWRCARRARRVMGVGQ